MQYTTLLALLSAVAAPALAAPAPVPGVESVSMMATGKWTIEDFKRVCKNGVCTYTYGINLNNDQPATQCKYDISGSPASRASYGNIKCGKDKQYTISSSWSGQFGEGKGFTTLAIVKGKKIIYPSYTDVQLEGGKVVKPDQGYTPQNLPGQ